MRGWVMAVVALSAMGCTNMGASEVAVPLELSGTSIEGALVSRGRLKVLQVPEPSAQDLFEASTVVAQSSGHQFEIQLGHMCNNRCVFCVSGHLSKNRLVRPLEVQPILDVIEQAREEGAVRLIFLGGEPTIQPAFLPALEHASKLEFSEIVIFTNGVRLPQKGFLDTVLAITSGPEEGPSSRSDRQRLFRFIEMRVIPLLEASV